MKGTEQSPILDARAMRLFPTVVWRAEIRPDACRRINEAIVAKLAALRRGTAAPAAGRGWQSGHDLHELHEFRELTEIIDVTVKDVLDYLRIGEVAFEMSGCWANMNAPGAAHGLHSHPNNFLSGVYYVRVPNGGDTINFHDPRSQTGILRPPVVELTADNTDQVGHAGGRGHGPAVPRVAAAFGGRQPRRSRPDQCELQHHAVRLHGAAERAAMAGRAPLTGGS